MNTKKLTISTFLIIFLLFVPPALGQSKQQNNSSNNWIWQVLGLSGLGLAGLQWVLGKINQGNQFERQKDISVSTAPIALRIDEIDDKLIVIDTKLTEQENENKRIREFAQGLVRNSSDRLEGRIQQTKKDLEAEKKRNEASQAKLEEAVKEATKEIHEMSLNIARMTESFKHFQTNQK